MEQPSKTWQAAAFDRVNNEWVHTTLHSYDHTREDLDDVFIRQAPPVKITPSRAKKPIDRDHQVIGVLPDFQYGFRYAGEVYEPLHDERALQAAKLLLKDIKPDVIVLLGDLLDNSNLSKYENDSNDFADTVQFSIDGLHRYLAGLRADHPEARMVWLAGNHETRLTKTILRHTAQLVNIRPADMPESWHVLSIPFLMRTDDLGIEYYGGYPANEFEYDEKTLFVHGTRVRSNGSTAELMSKTYPDINVFFGHVHRHEMHTRTNRQGEYIVAATFGTLARIDGIVPSYNNGLDDRGHIVKRFENWQQGMGIIRHYGDSMEINHVQIHNGVARFEGKEYGV